MAGHFVRMLRSALKKGKNRGADVRKIRVAGSRGLGETVAVAPNVGSGETESERSQPCM